MPNVWINSEKSEAAKGQFIDAEIVTDSWTLEQRKRALRMPGRSVRSYKRSVKADNVVAEAWVIVVREKIVGEASYPVHGHPVEGGGSVAAIGVSEVPGPEDDDRHRGSEMRCSFDDPSGKGEEGARCRACPECGEPMEYEKGDAGQISGPEVSWTAPVGPGWFCTACGHEGEHSAPPSTGWPWAAERSL